MEKPPIKSILFSIAAIIVGTLLIFFGSKESKRGSQINEEIEVLQKEAQKIKKENSDLREKIAYFETEDFQEREAKRKLNLQKEGEKVVIIKPSQALDEVVVEEGVVRGDDENNQNLPNYTRWWNHFFNKNNG